MCVAERTQRRMLGGELLGLARLPFGWRRIRGRAPLAGRRTPHPGSREAPEARGPVGRNEGERARRRRRIAQKRIEISSARYQRRSFLAPDDWRNEFAPITSAFASSRVPPLR